MCGARNLPNDERSMEEKMDNQTQGNGMMPNNTMPNNMVPNNAMPNNMMPNGNYMGAGGMMTNGGPVNGNYMGPNGMMMNGALPPAPKKSRKGLVIGILVAVVVVILAVAAILVYNLVYNTPKARLERAFQKLRTEMSNSEDDFIKELKYDEILAKAKENPTSVTASIDMVLPFLEDEVFDTIGVDYTGELDIAGRKRDDLIDVSVANVDLLTLHTTILDNELYVALPGYLSDTYLVNLDTIGKDYKDSVWHEMMEADLDEDFSFDAFSEGEDNSGFDAQKYGTQIAEELLPVVQEHTEALSKAVSYKKGNGYISVTIEKDAVNDFIKDLGDAVTDSKAIEECMDAYLESVYHGAIDQETIDEAKEEVADALSELFDISFKNDPEIWFYLDNKGRISSIETAEDIRFDSSYLSKIAFSMDFTGEENPTDSITCKLKVTSVDDETCNMTFKCDTEQTKEERSQKITMDMQYVDEYGDKEEETLTIFSTFREADKEFTIKVSGEEDGENTFAVSVEGAFTAYTPGESLTLTIGSGEIESAGESILKFSGTYSVGPSDKTISKPEGAVKLFDMTEMDIYGAVMELQEAFENLSGLLE